MIAVLLIQRALIYLYKVQRPHSRWLNYVKPQNIGNMMLKQLKKGSSSTHVMETFGGVGKEAVAFIKKISNLHYEHSPVPVHRNALSSFIFRSLSIILQRGNALVQLMAAQYARKWAGGQCGY